MYKAIIYLALMAASSAQFLPNGCPSNFGVHLLLPHESDCAKYYSCSNGNKIEMNCPAGLLFDANLQTCVAKAEGGCTYNTSIPTPETTTLDPISTFCPPGSWGNVPHPEICEAFYMCINGAPIQLFCVQGFEFDPVTSTCVAKAEGGCTYNTSIPTPETTTLDPISTFCPPGSWGNVPHPEICEAFYMCINGAPIQLFCVQGFEFDPVTSSCVEISENGCTSKLKEKKI